MFNRIQRVHWSLLNEPKYIISNEKEVEEYNYNQCNEGKILAYEKIIGSSYFYTVKQIKNYLNK